MSSYLLLILVAVIGGVAVTLQGQFMGISKLYATAPILLSAGGPTSTIFYLGNYVIKGHILKQLLAFFCIVAVPHCELTDETQGICYPHLFA
jgi:hypothetical protein